ncbi:unknown [Fusobacterium sp. CAG:439]|nr:unknown [Fusobacterium sp. CAG:439]
MTENTSNSVKFKIGPSGVEFEASGDSDFIEHQREKFSEMILPVTRVIPLLPVSQNATPLLENKHHNVTTTVNENIVQQQYDNFAHYNSEMRFSSDMDRVGGAAYYLAIIKHVEPFTIDNIKEELKSARIPELTNISATIGKLLEKPYILEEKLDGKRVFKMSQKGIEYFQNYQPKEKNTKNKKSSKATKSPKATKDYPSLSVSVDDLHCEKYCDIEKLPNYADQIWVLMYMYTNETEYKSFSREEVATLLRKRFRINVSEWKIRHFFEEAGSKLHTEGTSRNIKYVLMQGGIAEAERIISENKTKNE